VRFDWGADGAAAIGADADVIVWVHVVPRAFEPSLLPGNADVVGADFASAPAVADWIVERQRTLARRLTIAVIAAGAKRESAYRFAVEDLLASGSVIRSLGERGLDATSPEAAAAEAAFAGLSRGLAHLVSASVSIAARNPDEAPVVTRVDPNLTPNDVRILRSGR
jgi:hypothetical protein